MTKSARLHIFLVKLELGFGAPETGARGGNLLTLQSAWAYSEKSKGRHPGNARGRRASGDLQGAGSWIGRFPELGFSSEIGNECMSKTLTSLWKDQYWSRREKSETRREEVDIKCLFFFFLVVSRAVFEVGGSGLLIGFFRLFSFQIPVLEDYSTAKRKTETSWSLVQLRTKSEEVSWKRRSQDIYVISQSFASIRRDWQASRE